MDIVIEDKKSELAKKWNNPSYVAKFEKYWDNYRCDAIAKSIESIEPGAIIVGFSDTNNPGTKYFDGDGDDGHTFVLIDNRYIVDPWMLEPEHRSVWDMKDPDDLSDIKILYGDPSNWNAK